MTPRPPHRRRPRPPAPSYPQFTGHEPCAQLGFSYYWVENGAYTRYERDTIRDACLERCPLYAQCLEWALHRERWGYWAGTTEIDRERLRRERGITVEEPQYAILPSVEVSRGIAS